MDLKSLRARFSILFGVALALVLTGLGGTLGLAVLNRSSAPAINISGTLRMQIYRLDAAMLHSRTPIRRRAVQALLTKMENTLYSPVIRHSVSDDFSGNAKRNYLSLLNMWHKKGEPGVQGYLNTSAWEQASRRFDSQAAPLMLTADRLVRALQYSATARNRLALRVLVAALLLLTSGALLFITLLRRQILTPLQHLLYAISAIKAGRMTTISESGASEIRLLVRQFNRMISLLSARHRRLEAEVEARTRDLTRQNRLLNLLYGVERILSNRDRTRMTNYLQTLQLAERMLCLDRVILCLANAERDHAVPTTTQGRRAPGSMPRLCDPNGCRCCLAETSNIEQENGPSGFSIKVGDGNNQLGVLKVRLKADQNLNEFQRTTLKTLAVRLGADVASSRRETIAREQELLEERIAVGRDLHDSLAQTLAYLPIQILRLRRALTHSATKPEIKDPGLARDAIRELDRAIATATYQIRELITVFRISAVDDDFSIGLQRLCDKFVADGLSVGLNNEVPDDMLNANERVHLLHIVHEALSNIARHSSAEHAKLFIRLDPRRGVVLSVEDDGSGFDPAGIPGENSRHFGLVVMKERAVTLGGRLIIEKNEPHGTRVFLHFRPRGHAADSTALPAASHA